MTKSDLMTGMLVKLRNGKVYRVYKELAANSLSQNCDLLMAYGFIGLHQPLTNYNNDLTHKHYDYLDIVEVRLIWDTGYLTRRDFRFDDLKLLWKREEKKKYTYEQLKEILGEEFEIVKE